MPATDTEKAATNAQFNGDFTRMMELAPVVGAEQDQKRTIVSPTASKQKGCANSGLGCTNTGGAYPTDTDTGGLPPGSDLK